MTKSRPRVRARVFIGFRNQRAPVHSGPGRYQRKMNDGNRCAGAGAYNVTLAGRGLHAKQAPGLGKHVKTLKMNKSGAGAPIASVCWVPRLTGC